ncbi:MAG: cytochrome c [Ignavibacteriaceae bacterium]|nr:cytochrome c [Ignavibacteriaceae bacterium]
MTKTQIWSTIFLVLFIALFFLHKATKEEPEVKPAMGENYEETQSGAGPGPEFSAQEAVVNWGCNTCHGQDLRGTQMAPTLYGLSEFYDRDRLINYLRNPNSFMDSERFKEFKAKYKNIVMPAYNNKDVKELGKVADYLLGLQ